MKSFFYSGDPESLISSLLRAKVPLQQHHGELNTTTPPPVTSTLQGALRSADTLHCTKILPFLKRGLADARA